MHLFYGTKAMSLSPLVTLASAIKPPSPLRAVSRIDADIRAETEKLERARGRFESRKTWLQRRADRLWDVDQRARVATLALKLKRNPGHVVTRLETLYHGCKYLMDRWAYLIQSVSSSAFEGRLKPTDRTKALCLLGIDPDEQGVEGYPIDLPNLPREGPDWVIQAREELKRIFNKELQRVFELAELQEIEDSIARKSAIAGEFLARDKDPDLRLHETAVVTCERRLRVLDRERVKAQRDEPPAEVTKIPISDQAPATEAIPLPPTPSPLL